MASGDSMRPKIKLPWADEIDNQQAMREEKALKFWILSKGWNGLSQSNMNVGDAITMAGEILMGLDPHCIVAKQTIHIQCNLIEYGCKAKMLKKKPIPNNNNERRTILL